MPHCVAVGIGGVAGLLDGILAPPNIKDAMFGGRTTFGLLVSCAVGGVAPLSDDLLMLLPLSQVPTLSLLLQASLAVTVAAVVSEGFAAL